MASLLSSDLMRALRRDDGVQVTDLMNSVKRTPSHEKRAVKLLFESIERNKLSVTQTLLEWGANPDGEVKGVVETALTKAVRRNSFEAVNLLVQGRADVNRPDAEGWTPLHRVKNRRIAELLLDAGADVDGANSSFLWTPLIMACGLGGDDVAQLLIERGASIEPDGGSPLLQAASCNHLRIVKMLLERGVRVRREVKVEGTPEPLVFDALEHARLRSKFLSDRAASAQIIALLEAAQARQTA